MKAFAHVSVQVKFHSWPEQMPQLPAKLWGRAATPKKTANFDLNTALIVLI